MGWWVCCVQFYAFGPSLACSPTEGAPRLGVDQGKLEYRRVGYCPKLCLHLLACWWCNHTHVTFPICILVRNTIFVFYFRSMYFYLHIISLLIILFLPVKPHAHIQRQPQTLNSINKKKKDWYLQEKAERVKLQNIGKLRPKGSRVLQWLRSNVYVHFFLSAGRIFIKPF